MALPHAEDAVAPLGALFIHMISTVCLALAAVKVTLALALPAIQCMPVSLLDYTSNGGIIEEGGTNSTMIAPCHSSSVAVMGMVVMISLIMSLNGVINMATIVSGG
jgi:hypothetical protein